MIKDMKTLLVSILMLSQLYTFKTLAAEDLCLDKMTESEFNSERTTVFFIDIYQGALLCRFDKEPDAGIQAYYDLRKKFAPVIGKNQNILEEYFLSRGLDRDPLNRFMTTLANNFGIVDDRGCQSVLRLKEALKDSTLEELVSVYEPFYQNNIKSNPKFGRACTYK